MLRLDGSRIGLPSYSRLTVWLILIRNNLTEQLACETTQLVVSDGNVGKVDRVSPSKAPSPRRNCGSITASLCCYSAKVRPKEKLPGAMPCVLWGIDRKRAVRLSTIILHVEDLDLHGIELINHFTVSDVYFQRSLSR